jgi:ABC-type Mn2+/Zn2+ transport system ATPase subunit
MPSVLEVSGLTIAFGDLRVIDGLSFTVRDGESLAIIGPSGSGKTVLFRALIGAVPYRGTIRWAPDARIGYVPQKLDIERDLPLTGIDLLRAKAHVGRVALDDIARALQLVNLGTDIVGAPIGTLSGGQFQRLLLACAFLGGPSVLLFDEPTAGVDAPGEEMLYETIHRVQQQQRLTLLLISHDLSLVYRHATTVLCLGRGRAWLGPPSEVLTPGRLEELYGGPMTYHFHP